VELANRGRYRDVLICRDHEAIPRDAPYLRQDGLVVAAIQLGAPASRRLAARRLASGGGDAARPAGGDAGAPDGLR